MDFRDYYRAKSEDALCLAADLFHAHDFLWSLPLVYALTDPVESSEVTHAVVWDERCLHRMLPLTKSPHHELLSRDLGILCDMRARFATADQIVERARQIWYRPEWDHAQAAVSQFYGAVAGQLYPSGRRSIVCLGVGVAVLAIGEEFPPAFLDIALEEFQYVYGQRERGVTPSQMLNLAGIDHYGFLNIRRRI